MRGKINVIFGATASGKTALGIKLAQELDGVVINADSMQVYREIPIITAQPTEDELTQAPHLLYGYKSVFDKHSVAIWLDDVIPAIKSVLESGKTPILVGGTGLYIDSLIKGISNIPDVPHELEDDLRTNHSCEELYKKLQDLDPTMAEKLKPNDKQRVARALGVILSTGKSISYWQQQKSPPPFSRDMFHLIWLNPDRAAVYEKINNRFDAMFENGLLKEVEELYPKCVASSTIPKAHGLPELFAYLRGETSLAQARDKAKQNTRNYAKRQLTWARHQLQFDEII